MAGKLLQLFPRESRAFWENVACDERLLQEIRLRAGKPIMILGRHGEWMLDHEGKYTRNIDKAISVDENEIAGVLQHICHYSLYAFEDELCQGFVTVAGGHRIGIAGQVVLESNHVRTIKHVSFLNIRISHQIKGAADEVISRIYRDGCPLNTLIISPPGCGKTTLLRDLVRQVSDGNLYGKGCNVGLVDERSEIAGCFQGIPQNDVGMRTDVLDACPKALGMMMLLRSMAPEVIAVDEIGGDQDIQSLRMASCCGCKILATIHGQGIEDVMIREGMNRLMEEKLFECILILQKRKDQFSIKVIERG